MRRLMRRMCRFGRARQARARPASLLWPRGASISLAVPPLACDLLHIRRATWQSSRYHAFARCFRTLRSVVLSIFGRPSFTLERRRA